MEELFGRDRGEVLSGADRGEGGGGGLGELSFGRIWGRGVVFLSELWWRL